jgi:bifunctional non-homologous end joining protein LigD
MPKRPFEPCIPSRVTDAPAGPDWIHEIKHDGYRLIVQREGKRVRLFTRNGHDWTDRYPLIVEAALRNHATSFVIDGEAVLLGVDGVSDFDGLHTRKHDAEVQLYAFDCLALEGDDLRKLPLSMRKTNLARLLARRPDGIFVAPFEQGEIGPDLFRKACEFGLEGLVSKHRDRAYRAGTSPNWVKTKNPAHPAMMRVKAGIFIARRVGAADHHGAALSGGAGVGAWRPKGRHRHARPHPFRHLCRSSPVCV